MNPSPLMAEYARLVVAYDDAKNAAWAAQVKGDHDGRERAELARETAATDLQILKEHAVADLMLTLRWVAEIHGPEYLARLLDLPDLEQRVGELEHAVAAIEDREGILS